MAHRKASGFCVFARTKAVGIGSLQRTEVKGMIVVQNVSVGGKWINGLRFLRADLSRIVSSASFELFWAKYE